MEDLSATQGELPGDAMLCAVCARGKCAFSLTKSLFFQAVSLHHRFPPRYMESSVVRLHHSNRAPELYGGERPHPGEHRDIGLHGEVWQRLARGLVAPWPPTFHPGLIDSVLRHGTVFLLSRWRLYWSPTRQSPFLATL